MRWLLLLSLFASCGLRQPNICLPSAFAEEEGIIRQEGPITDLNSWWDQFNDSHLSSLIERALRCNIDLRVARERICEARGIYGMEFSYLLPWVDQVSTFDRIRNSETLADTDFTGGTFVNFYKVGFDALWEIDLFGKLFDRARGAALDMVAQAELVRQVHVSVAAEVANYYFDIISYNKKINITKEHIASEERLVDHLEDRFQAGYDPALDLSTAKGVLFARKADLPQLEMKRKQAIFALAVMLGLNPEELIGHFENNRELPDPTGKIPLGLPSDLLCRRGDVREAEYQLAAAGARVLAARKELFPELSLKGFFQFATGFYDKLFNLGSRQWTITPTLDIPVFRGGNIRSFIKVETSKQHQAVLHYELAVLQALQEVESGLVGFFEQEARVKATTQEVKYNKEARQLAAVRFEDGLSDFLFLIELERELFFSQLEGVNSEIERLHQFISIYKALGGGWEC